MKKIFLTFTFLNLCIFTYGQIIKGTVFDKETKNPLGFAYLYFNGTSAGTQSDLNGNFELDVSRNTPNPLTVSAIGYYSLTLTDYFAGKPLTVYLVPKVFELNEITLGAKSLAKKRNANMIIFKNAFLGSTENARYCEILNESDIKFNYDSDRDTLRIFASKPLFIINRALGYKIAYFLDNFEYNRNDKSFFFHGNITFMEDLNTNQSQKLYIENKRKDAYLGSRMHFFRALWNNDLRSNGFAVQSNYGRNLPTKEIVFQDAGNRKYLKYKGPLWICYNSDAPLSSLDTQKDRIYFDENGYFDSFGITWEGSIAERRIADMLPLEYVFPDEQAKPERDFKRGDAPAISNPEPDSIQAIEKVYLHTDRNYYYSGEDIWFKAYLINASNNLLTDQINNLHIELISPGTKIIDSRIIRIENGLGNGDFSIPENLPSGQYRLRAYTNYMRNFGDQTFLNKDISIINPLDPAGKSEDSIKYIENKINISFSPEGGSLVDNVSSIVAFKAVDALGKSCDVSGDIYSSDGKLITSLRSVHKGMGTFSLKPLPGLTYSAIIKNTSGERINVEIPGSFSTGVTQSVIKDESDNFIVTIKTNPQTLPLIRDKDLLLNISARNIPLKTIIFRIKSLYNKITIPSNDLPDGIMMLTLSSVSQELPLCERLVFL